jgi:purine-binding chemotaxis protein CheW
VQAAEPKPEPVRLVCFDLDGQEFGLIIDSVKETLTMRPLTSVYLTPRWVLGIINLRGDVVPLLDLAELLGMAATPVRDDSRIVIVDHGGLLAGVVVDALGELRRVDLAELAAPPSTLSEETREIISGVWTTEGGSALRVLDLDALFASDRIKALARNRE